MRRLMVLAVLAVGCGRIGYDDVGSDDGGDGLSLAYPTDDVVAVVDVTRLELVPIVDRAVDGFTIAPALPAGLALDASRGVLAGVARVPVDGVTYTITATAGADQASVALRLTALPGHVVDVTADFPDDDGGADLTCHATPAGGCTLRAAIQTANQRASRQLVLLIAGDYRLGSALPAITNDVLVAGAGSDATTVRAATLHPGHGLFTLATARTLGLRHLTIRDFGEADGAAVSLTAGLVEVDRCAFVDNAGAGSGGVFFVSGGARATIRTSRFVGNQSFGGCCGGWGGVIDGEGDGTTIDVEACVAIANRSAWGSFAHITTGTTLRLVSSTLFGNVATTAGTLASPGGHYVLVNDTIVGNHNDATATDSAGLYLFQAPAHYTVSNTIVAFNTDSSGGQNNCNRRDLGAALTSTGGNLFGDGAGNCAAYLVGPGDRLATDPGLEPGGPADHGGPTPTIPPAPGSPALGGGHPPDCPPFDQRGRPRPGGGAPCDIGAVELP